MEKEDIHFNCPVFSIEMWFQKSSQLVARPSTTWARKDARPRQQPALHSSSMPFYIHRRLLSHSQISNHALHRQLWERERKFKFAAAQLEEEAGEAADLPFYSSSKFWITIEITSDCVDVHKVSSSTCISPKSTNLKISVAGKLYKARSRLYRSQILQVNTRWNLELGSI